MLKHWSICIETAVGKKTVLYNVSISFVMHSLKIKKSLILPQHNFVLKLLVSPKPNKIERTFKKNSFYAVVNWRKGFKK
jgi:hypothetical protein